MIELDVARRFFGTRWNSPDVELAIEVPIPVGELCLDCNEPIEPADRGLVVLVVDHFTDLDVGTQRATATWRPIHLECSFRPNWSHVYQQCDCYATQPRSLRAEALATLEAINTDRASEGKGPL